MNPVLLSYDEVRNKLTSISVLRDRAFLSLAYGTLARVGEVVKGRYKFNPPIRRNQIFIGETHIFVTIQTEKTGLPRRVPINMVKEPWLVQPILEYMTYLGDDPNRELFPFSTRWGEKIFERWFGTQHIHLLRHWRATHLLQGVVTGAPLHSQIVARMGGWTDLGSLSKTYDGSVVEDYLLLI